MSCGRLGAEMSSSSFGHAWNRGSQFSRSRSAGSARYRSRSAGLIWEIPALTAGRRQGAGLVSSRSDNCRNPSPKIGKAGKQKAPTPKNAARKPEHDGNCRHYEAKSYENVHDAFLKAWLYFSFASTISFSFPTNARAEVVRLRCLWQLPGECLRNQADVGTADATEAGAIEILSCTVWTKHSHPPINFPPNPNRILVERGYLPFQLANGSLSQSFIENNACGH